MTKQKTTNYDQSLDQKEIKLIAKETYIALFPLVYNYGTMYNQAINNNAPEYLGGFGLFKHYGLSTPENRDIPTPNKKCPICGKSKYKKCCKPASNKLVVYGVSHLKSDIEISRKCADEILANS